MSPDGTDFLHRPLLIDVDTGVDDAIALALGVAQGANIIGVSTVAGNVPIEIATRNTLDVLARLGRDDIPVHRGASRPLVAGFQDATHVHGGNGLGGVSLDPSSAAEATLAGPAFIIQSAARYDGELVLVTLGPLTNLAIALNVRPEITRHVDRVVVMGGASFVPGNVTPTSEFNIYADPEAASQVLDAQWNDLTLVGLDVTHRTLLSRDQWQRIDPDEGSVAGLIRGVMERTFTERGMSGFYLHDPLALAVALDPGLVTGEFHDVAVEGTSATARGQTTATKSVSGGVLVALEVEADRFVGELSSTLGLPRADSRLGFENAE